MPDLNDQYDDDDDAVVPGALAPSPLDAREALGQETLAHALTRKARRLLSQPARVMILHVPSVDWVDLIAKAVPKIAGTVAIKTAREETLSNKIAHRVGRDALRHLHNCRTVVFISQNPDGILDETVLAAADATIVISPPTPALLRKVIARVSKGAARGVSPEMADLPLPVILCAIRPGIPARACVNNLARALLFKPVAAAPVPTVPLLTDLPLTASLRRWTDQALADMAEVKAGTAPHRPGSPRALASPPATRVVQSVPAPRIDPVKSMPQFSAVAEMFGSAKPAQSAPAPKSANSAATAIAAAFGPSGTTTTKSEDRLPPPSARTLMPQDRPSTVGWIPRWSKPLQRLVPQLMRRPHARRSPRCRRSTQQVLNPAWTAGQKARIDPVERMPSWNEFSAAFAPKAPDPPKYITQTKQVPVAQKPVAQKPLAQIVAPAPKPQPAPVPQQSSSTWAPQGYTNNGSGKITSNETGGVYYERHLR